jgi:hypothetical protein
MPNLPVRRCQVYLCKQVFLALFLHSNDVLGWVLHNFVHFFVACFDLLLQQLLVQLLVQYQISKPNDAPPKNFLCFFVELDRKLVCNRG